MGHDPNVEGKENLQFSIRKEQLLKDNIPDMFSLLVINLIAGQKQDHIIIGIKKIDQSVSIILDTRIIEM